MYRYFNLVFLLAVSMLIFSQEANAVDWGDPVPEEQKIYSRTKQDSPKHDGLDIIGTSRNDIHNTYAVATADGTVKFTGSGKPYTGYGNIIIIDHGGGYESWYAHLESIDDAIKKAYENYKKGDKEKAKVTKGETVGKIDATGISKPPGAHHLHFEIRKNGTPLNPLEYLPCCYQKQPQGPPLPICPLCHTPGGGHPDDTFSVADAIFPDVPVDLTDAYYRLAVKGNKTVVINYFVFKKLIQERDAYLEGLADGVAPDQAYLDAVGGRINLLYESFGVDQRLLWDEIASLADVAVLDNGFYDADVKFLNRLREPAFETNANFNPADVVKDQPVLLIPSGGLYGLENSAFLKVSLDEYVKQGGTLVVFAQQRGYEFSVLPTPDGRQVTGYGWEEDQNCFTDAVYIETWHQLLSGQSRGTPTLNVDGYFTSYPSNSTVILRRTANGQPAMLMYEHGLGRVIVTSMYTDWAYGHSQASREEIALVRDLISWAMKPSLLTEARPGEAVSLPLSLINSSSTDATQARLTVLDPDRNIIAEQTIGAGLPVGGSGSIPFFYTTASTAPLGIYHVDYTLSDAQGNIIQPQAETDSGRFALSSPPTEVTQIKPLTMSITASTEYYFSGQEGTFTWHVWNNSTTERTVTVRYGFPHHAMKDGTYGSFPNYSKTLTIAPQSEATFTHAITIATEDSVHSYLYDEI